MAGSRMEGMPAGQGLALEDTFACFTKNKESRIKEEEKLDKEGAFRRI